MGHLLVLKTFSRVFILLFLNYLICIDWLEHKILPACTLWFLFCLEYEFAMKTRDQEIVSSDLSAFVVFASPFSCKTRPRYCLRDYISFVALLPYNFELVAQTIHSRAGEVSSIESIVDTMYIFFWDFKRAKKMKVLCLLVCLALI